MLNYTRAYASYGVRAAIAPDVPNNEGSLAPIRVDAPIGSILNVEKPAPVSARHIIGQFLPELVLGCLADVLPDLVPAEGAACNWGLQLRGRAENRPFDILFFNAGGSGARPSRDGLSATTFPSGIRSIPVEVCETAAPIVIHRKELLPDTRRRRPLSRRPCQRIEVGTLDGSPFQLFAVFDRVDNPARGRAGGMAGAPGHVRTLAGVPLRSKGQQTIAAGDGVRIDTPGGAGFGPAAERDPALVAYDIEQGYVHDAQVLITVPSVKAATGACSSRSCSSGTTHSGRSPRATRCTLSNALRKRATWLSQVGPAKCAVSTTLSSWSSGLSGRRRFLDQTRRARHRTSCPR